MNYSSVANQITGFWVSCSNSLYAHHWWEHVAPEILQEIHSHGSMYEQRSLAVLDHVLEVVVVDEVCHSIPVLHAAGRPQGWVQKTVPSITQNMHSIFT